MTAYDDPQTEIPSTPEDEPRPDDSAIKVYERPKPSVPGWMLALYVLIGLALLWFLFAYVF